MKTTFIVIGILVILAIAVIFILKHSKEGEQMYENASNNKDEDEEEVIIPQECKLKEEEEPLKENAYFFNIHHYTTTSGKDWLCIIVTAIIQHHTYKIVAPNSFYPRLESYSEKLLTNIKNPFTPNLTAEEFINLGYKLNNTVGQLVCSIYDLYTETAE